MCNAKPRTLRPSAALFVATSVWALLLAAGDIRAETLVVDPKAGPYFDIPSALADANDGDTIEVNPGIYAGQLGIQDRQISLISTQGPEVTRLRAASSRRVLRILNSEVYISGFTIEDGRSTHGAGIAAADSDLEIDTCIFRNNGVEFSGNSRPMGGALYLAKESSLRISETLFVENFSRSSPATGSAIAYSLRDWAAGGEGADSDGWNIQFDIRACSFLREDPGPGQVIHLARPSSSTIEDCAFTGEILGPNFISATSSTITCCNFWNGPAPQRYDTQTRAGVGPVEMWGRRKSDDEIGSAHFIHEFLDDVRGQNTYRDPRICPEDTETVHRSSPLLSLCGRSGPVTVGCQDAMLLSVYPDHLRSVPVEVLTLYGYALESVDEVRLVHASGYEAISQSLVRNDEWSRCTFDLTAVPRGALSLELWSAGALLVRRDNAFDFGGPEPRRFRPAWIAANEPREIDLALADAREGLSWDLVAEDGSTIPIGTMTATARDTLRAVLPALSAGIYGLRYQSQDGLDYSVEAMLRVGDPNVRNVPGDFPTIGAALVAADPGDEIRVAAGTFPESVVIDRPIRLIGSEESTTHINLIDKPGSRGVHVTPSAGRIVEIQNLFVTHAKVDGGPGAGVYAERPIRLENTTVYGCKAFGEGSVGGGMWAAAGSEVLNGRFISNVTEQDPVLTNDVFFDPGTGTAGGLFCVGCRIESTEFEHNHAGQCGNFVVDGIFRGNTTYNGSLLSAAGTIYSFALRGDVHENHFGNRCGSDPPFGVFAGPSRVTRNTFVDTQSDRCDGLSLILIQGPVEFINNSVADMWLQVCRHHQLPAESAGQVQIRNNLVEYDGLMSFPDPVYCENLMGPGPIHEYPLTDVLFADNLGDPVNMFGLDLDDTCENCITPVDEVGFCGWTDSERGRYFDFRLVYGSPALPDVAPITADTLGAIPRICTPVVPVRVPFSRLQPGDDGILVEWSLSSDLDISASKVTRRDTAEEDVGFTTLSPWMTQCGDCSYLDHEASADAEYEYGLVLLHPNGEEEHVVLGTIRVGSPSAELSLSVPRPNPSRGNSQIRFHLPRSTTVTIEIFEPSGRRVDSLFSGPAAAGNHTVETNVAMPGGTYWVRLRTREGDVRTRTLVVL